MSFDKQRLPDPTSYFESEGLILKGPKSAPWKTTRCEFHGGSDSMRVKVDNGAFRCMNCGEKGGDVLAYEMKKTGLDFVSAAKSLGAWVNDGRTEKLSEPKTLSPRLALEVLNREATLAAIAAGNLANGVALTDDDRTRLFVCANRIMRIAEEYPA